MWSTSARRQRLCPASDANSTNALAPVPVKNSPPQPTDTTAPGEVRFTADSFRPRTQGRRSLSRRVKAFVEPRLMAVRRHVPPPRVFPDFIIIGAACLRRLDEKGEILVAQHGPGAVIRDPATPLACRLCKNPARP